MRRDEALLLDMLIASRNIVQFTTGLDRSGFERNKLVQSAVLREIQVIGEAAKKITDQTKNVHPHIAWGAIIGMRNRIVHEYFNIDLEILWDTVQANIPVLIDHLTEIVPPDNA